LFSIAEQMEYKAAAAAAAVLMLKNLVQELKLEQSS
jgi:hypothetical protein